MRNLHRECVQFEQHKWQAYLIPAPVLCHPDLQSVLRSFFAGLTFGANACLQIIHHDIHVHVLAFYVGGCSRRLCLKSTGDVEALPICNMA